MTTLLKTLLVFGLVSPAFSSMPKVDFDGKSGDTKDAITSFNSFRNVNFKADDIPSPATPNPTDTPSRIAGEITPDGEKPIAPTAKGAYAFMPNTVNYWRINCGNEDSSPGTWGACWSFSFRPTMAGHNHAPTSTLAYINPSNPPNLLPTQICKYNIPINTPQYIYFRTPYYSSGVLDKVDFYGRCTGTISDDVEIRVTAKNLIQLTELTAEPYFDFKISDDQQAHPGNHFATPDTNSKIKQIAWEYYQQYNQKITINDMGLIWGGRYSTFSPYNCWTDGNEHFYHRYGRQVDVRSWAIPQENRACFKEIACKYQVHPILEGKAPGTLPEKDYANITPFEAEILDRTEHYHLNFVRPTDPAVEPIDDARTSCSTFIPPEVSACPKPLGLTTLP